MQVWWQTDPKAEVLYGMTPFNAMANNPVKFNDPDGDIIPAMLLGAGIGLVANGAANIAADQNFFAGAGKAALFGALGGAASFGIGQAATALAKGGATAFQVGAFQAGAHGLSGGLQSVAQGGNFGSGFLSGSIASAVSGYASSQGAKMGTMIGLGGLMGGIGAEIGGGSFWRGVGTGLIASTLNHAAHSGDLLGKGFAASLRSGKIGHWFKPDAIGVGVNVGGAAGPVGQDIEVAAIKMLRGPQKGETFSVLDVGIAAGLDASAGIKGTAFYYTGSTKNFTINLFSGARFEANFGGTIAGVDIGVSYSRAKVSGGHIYGYGLKIGFSPMPFRVGGNVNYGDMKINPFQEDYLQP